MKMRLMDSPLLISIEREHAARLGDAREMVSVGDREPRYPMLKVLGALTVLSISTPVFAASISSQPGADGVDVIVVKGVLVK
jgi:hypothetical protein